MALGPVSLWKLSHDRPILPKKAFSCDHMSYWVHDRQLGPIPFPTANHADMVALELALSARGMIQSVPFSIAYHPAVAQGTADSSAVLLMPVTSLQQIILWNFEQLLSSDLDPVSFFFSPSFGILTISCMISLRSTLSWELNQGKNHNSAEDYVLCQ